MGNIIIIIIAIFILFIIRVLYKYHKNSFKVIIEKGKVTETYGDIPSEFLYDMQQLARIHQSDALILYGRGIKNNHPKLKISGVVDTQLKTKMEQSLILSLQ